MTTDPVALVIDNARASRGDTGPHGDTDRGWPAACINGEAHAPARVWVDFRCVGCVVAWLASIAHSPMHLDGPTGEAWVGAEHVPALRAALYAEGFLGGGR